MEHSAGLLLLVLLGTLGSVHPFQDKAPLQARIEKQVPGNANGDDNISSGRGIDESLLKTIGKAGIQLVVAKTTATPKPQVEHQHHYYYPIAEENQHPRQYGYLPPPPPPPNPYQPWPGVPGVPGGPGIPGVSPISPGVLPIRGVWPPGPWNWGNGGWGNGGWGNGGWGSGGWGGVGGGGIGWDLLGYPGYPSYLGYPFYPPYFRSSANGQQEGSQAEYAPSAPEALRSAGYQARVLAATNNFVEGKSNSGALPLYHFLNVARV